MATIDETLLRITFDLAKQARKLGGYLFGALLVSNNQVIHQAYDGCIEFSDPTAHAELRVIREYCRIHNLMALEDYTLYTSTEPCAMCAGAIHWTRVSKVVYGISQSMLQKLSGGRKKLAASNIINSGRRQFEIVGPLLVEEGKAVFEDYQFIPKTKLKSQRLDCEEAT